MRLVTVLLLVACGSLLDAADHHNDHAAPAPVHGDAAVPAPSVQAAPATGHDHTVPAVAPAVPAHAAPPRTLADVAPLAAAADAAATTASQDEPKAQGLTGRQALDRLLAGNKRFMADLTSRSHHGATRRGQIAGHQNPVAVVVCCADSRVPPEQVFDQGLGDLFVVRTAGNVVDAIALGSIEYACEHLHVPLVVVLGHERCGAVTAACTAGDHPGRVQAVVAAIRTNTAETKPADGGTVEMAVQANAKVVARQTAGCTPIIEGLVRSEQVLVVAGRYDLDTGEVVIIP